jgi:UDP-2,3-diacylglucosamine pyrophosphatase LpxH
MGDSGPTDNFLHCGGEREFHSFLDYVEDRHGVLVVCGDAFEGLQVNLSKAVTNRLTLLDRLARMRARYIIGNHDIDLVHFSGGWLNHPFLRMALREWQATVDGTRYAFCHGHEADSACAGDAPGICRISAIYTAIKERKHGSPLVGKYRTIEQQSLGWYDRLDNAWRWLRGQPDSETAFNRLLLDLYAGKGIVVHAHTHKAGTIRDPLTGLLLGLNCGTWAELGPKTFVRIDPDGTAGVFDWIDRSPAENRMVLPC